MNGAFPPSSSETFFTWSAHCAHQELPDLGRAREAELAHERVRGHLAADRRRVRRVARDDGEDAGRHAGLLREGRDARAESGVCSAGLSIIVQPTASAGADFRVTIADGKFHGVIPAVTPTGSRVTTMRLSVHGERDHRAVEPLRLLGEPLVERGGVGDLGARLGERLALLEHHQRGEVVLALAHQRRRAAGARGLAPWRSAPSTPAAPARAASIARRVSAAPSRGHVGERLARRGIEHRERGAVVGVDPARRRRRPACEGGRGRPSPRPDDTATVRREPSIK